MNNPFIPLTELFEATEDQLMGVLDDWANYPPNHSLLAYGILKDKGVTLDEKSEIYNTINRNLEHGLDDSLNRYLEYMKVSSLVEMRTKIENGELVNSDVKNDDNQKHKHQFFLNFSILMSWMFLIVFTIATQLRAIETSIIWLLFNILFEYLQILIKNQDRIINHFEQKK